MTDKDEGPPIVIGVTHAAQVVAQKYGVEKVIEKAKEQIAFMAAQAGLDIFELFDLGGFAGTFRMEESADPYQFVYQQNGELGFVIDAGEVGSEIKLTEGPFAGKIFLMPKGFSDGE